MTNEPSNWDSRPKLETIRVGDSVLMPGSRVRLRPKGRADILDLALECKMATIEAIEQDFEERIYVAVILDDDPGREFGKQRQIGHRFFFGIEEIEPLAASTGATR